MEGPGRYLIMPCSTRGARHDSFPDPSRLPDASIVDWGYVVLSVKDPSYPRRPKTATESDLHGCLTKRAETKGFRRCWIMRGSTRGMERATTRSTTYAVYVIPQ